MTTAVVGVYTVPIGRSDHKGVVVQLMPEEEAGISRRTIPVEIIKTKEFQLEMQKELDRMSGLQGDAWWARMEEVAHSISAEVKAGQKDWTNSMWQLEEALSASSIRRLCTSPFHHPFRPASSIPFRTASRRPETDGSVVAWRQKIFSGSRTLLTRKETKRHFLCWCGRRSTTTHSVPPCQSLSSSLSPP